MRNRMKDGMQKRYDPWVMPFFLRFRIGSGTPFGAQALRDFTKTSLVQTLFFKYTHIRY